MFQSVATAKLVCKHASVNRYCFPFLVIFLGLVCCADQQGQQVIIDHVEPEPWTTGMTVHIVGSGFGQHTIASPDDEEEAVEVAELNYGLYLDGKRVSALHWSDDRITFSVPEDIIGETYVMVWNESHASNAFPVSIAEPPEDEPVIETAPTDSK